eukprot:c18633_g2_i2.p2 GENE.c18633_g2_i2~~c18633_g2_i2.p2  ORF type:complete len:166 (-),score=41.67 c18633_g2_i2:740-1237(-)
MYIATVHCRIDAAKWLLEHGADVEIANHAQESCMHAAAFYGHAKVAELLMEHGANPEAINRDGCTPLHTAALYSNVAMVQLLVRKVADMNSKCFTSVSVAPRSMTVREIALYHDQIEIITALDEEIKFRLQTFLMGRLRRGTSVVRILPVDVLGMIAANVIRQGG